MPAGKVTGGTPVINPLVLGLLFSTAIFRSLPIVCKVSLLTNDFFCVNRIDFFCERPEFSAIQKLTVST